MLKGNIFWITAGYNIPLFPDQYPGLTIIPVEAIPTEIFSLKFDLVINLEEDSSLAQTLVSIQSKKIIGVFWNNGMLDYSPDSATLFDMSLVSKLSTLEANELKSMNTQSYQAIICRMVDKPFSGEPYIIYRNTILDSGKTGPIGIERRVGSRWPNKYWGGYGKLKESLLEENYDVVVFEQRSRLRDYMQDIQKCRLIITGDTLAMHIALGYGIPCVAIFNCTSPNEIFDYGLLQKIVSPLLGKFFYNTEFVEEATEAIPVSKILKTVHKRLTTAVPRS
jgi:heptosyltransferase-2